MHAVPVKVPNSFEVMCSVCPGRGGDRERWRHGGKSRWWQVKNGENVGAVAVEEVARRNGEGMVCPTCSVREPQRQRCRLVVVLWRGGAGCRTRRWRVAGRRVTVVVAVSAWHNAPGRCGNLRPAYRKWQVGNAPPCQQVCGAVWQLVVAGIGYGVVGRSGIGVAR